VAPYTLDTWNLIGYRQTPQQFERAYAKLKAWKEANGKPVYFSNGHRPNHKLNTLKFMADWSGDAPVTTKDVAAAMPQAHPRSINRAMKQLIDLGLVEKRGAYKSPTYRLLCSAADAASGKALADRKKR